MNQRPLIIGVIGGSSPSQGAWDLAYEVGRELAARGAIVICGGLSGVMEAVCKGASEEGGTTVGILPGGDPNIANQYVSIPIATGVGYARNAIITRAAQAVIAIDGAFGTLSEIGHALGFGTTVVGLDTWRFSASGEESTAVVEASSPRDAVERAIAAATQRGEAQASGEKGPA